MLIRKDGVESDEHECLGLSTAGYEGDKYTEINALRDTEKSVYVYIVSNNDPIGYL